MSDRIELTYYGADAERHVLDLYDAGRALYGVARFIYTLENFRVSGAIVEHATSARAKFELLPSPHGSFTFDIEHILAAIRQNPENATLGYGRVDHWKISRREKIRCRSYFASISRTRT